MQKKVNNNLAEFTKVTICIYLLRMSLCYFHMGAMRHLGHMTYVPLVDEQCFHSMYHRLKIYSKKRFISLFFVQYLMDIIT